MSHFSIRDRAVFEDYPTSQRSDPLTYVRMGTDTNQHTTRQNQLPIRAGIDTGYLH